MSHGHEWRFSWLTTWDEVWDLSFIDQWHKWVAYSPDAHVFFEPSMVRMWVEYSLTRERVEPRFVVAEHVSGCTVFFPLVYARLGWKDSRCRVLQPVGADRFDYHDPICSENDHGGVLSSFWSALHEESTRSFGRTIDRVVIPRVRESWARSCQYFREVDKSPFIDLQNVAGIDTILSNGPKSVRQDAKRQLRRLESLGALELKICSGADLQPAKDALEGLIRAYSDRWGARETDAGFYRRMLSACLPSGFLHMSVLTSCGTAISWHMGFLYRRHFYYYKIAYDKEFGGYSPGKVHLMKLMEESLRQHVHVFDFLRGEEAYKYDWTKSSVGLYQMQIDLPTLRSQLARKVRGLVQSGRSRVRELAEHFHREEQRMVRDGANGDGK